MNLAKTAIAAALGTLFATAAFAQSNTDMYQRDINQQQRIEQGLRSGQLTVQEAAGLERETARVDRMQARALSDGRLTAEEAARISRAQDRVSQDIRRESTDSQTGNPNSRSSERMQADVQRNINQDRRIAQGVQSGQLTNREVSRLESEQARTHFGEARAGADGRIDRYEQRGIQRAENRNSYDIRNERHDGQFRGQQYGQRDGGRNFGEQRGWNQRDNREYGQNRGNSDSGRAQGNAEQGRHLGWTQGRGNESTTVTGNSASTTPSPAPTSGTGRNYGVTPATGGNATTSGINAGRQLGSAQPQRIAMANTGGTAGRQTGSSAGRGGSGRH